MFNQAGNCNRITCVHSLNRAPLRNIRVTSYHHAILPVHLTSTINTTPIIKIISNLGVKGEGEKLSVKGKKKKIVEYFEGSLNDCFIFE